MNNRSKRCKICTCRSTDIHFLRSQTRRFSQQDKENKVYGQVFGCKSRRDFACPNSKTRLRDPLEMACYDLQISWRRSTPYISIELSETINA